MILDIFKKIDKRIFFLGLILFLSAILRILWLDKAGGLWYDELVGSYKEASMPNILSIISYTMQVDIHFPLYPILLHIWAKIFSFSDFSLRLFSAICGILSVLGAYLAGKELKSSDTGLLCAAIFAINSFLIYYSQEVRMYSLLTLLSVFFTYFTIRLKNDYKNIYNYAGLVTLGSAVILTHTISVIFVASQSLAIFLYLFKTIEANERKFLVRNFGVSLLALFFLNGPLFAYVLLNKTHYTSFLSGFYSNWTSFLVSVQGWFTPVFSPVTPVDYLSSAGFSDKFFVLIPLIIACYAIFNSLKKDKFSYVLFASATIFILFEIVAFQFCNFKMAPRYSTVMVPNALILLGYGFSLLNNSKNIKAALISLFLGINLFYLLAMPNSAPKMGRGGIKNVCEKMTAAGIKKDDFVVVWNRTEIFDKYIPMRLNVLSLLRNFAYTSEVMLYNEKALSRFSMEQRKKLLRTYFLDESVPQNTSIIMDTIYNNQKIGQKFILMISPEFDKYTQINFIEKVKDDKKFSEMTYNDALSIKTILSLKKICKEKFALVKKENEGAFVILIYEKR